MPLLWLVSGSGRLDSMIESFRDFVDQARPRRAGRLFMAHLAPTSPSAVRP